MLGRCQSARGSDQAIAPIVRFQGAAPKPAARPEVPQQWLRNRPRSCRNRSRQKGAWCCSPRAPRLSGAARLPRPDQNPALGRGGPNRAGGILPVAAAGPGSASRHRPCRATQRAPRRLPAPDHRGRAHHPPVALPAHAGAQASGAALRAKDQRGTSRRDAAALPRRQARSWPSAAPPRAGKAYRRRPNPRSGGAFPAWAGLPAQRRWGAADAPAGTTRALHPTPRQAPAVRPRAQPRSYQVAARHPPPGNHRHPPAAAAAERASAWQSLKKLFQAKGTAFAKGPAWAKV